MAWKEGECFPHIDLKDRGRSFADFKGNKWNPHVLCVGTIGMGASREENKLTIVKGSHRSAGLI